MWEDISIHQFQKITEIIQSQAKDATDLDLESDIIGFMEGLDINAMTMSDFRKLREHYDYLLQPIPKTKPANTFKAKGRKYGVIYDVSNVNLGMYNEVIKFSEKQGIIKNLHKFMASIVVPMKRNWLGLWVVDKVKPGHNQLADAMLQAPFIVCYNAAVFFYQLFRNYFVTMRESYLMKLMEVRKITRIQAEEIYQVLMSNMDGYITQNS
jgi:hypothetical protein